MPDALELDSLNPDQLDAVVHRGGPLLVVAGAGSGKTRVLTHRIAHLIHEGAPPSSILAITFTNKAAQEMRHRVEALVGPVVKAMWVTTFHSACVRILRAEADALGYPRNFSIYDAAVPLSLPQAATTNSNATAGTAASAAARIDLTDGTPRWSSGSITVRRSDGGINAPTPPSYT